VEKPLAQSVADAERAVAAADRADRILMVGHLLQYHPGVTRLKQLVDQGQLGDVRYIYGNRLNLGKLRADENALWSLGAHDVSVLLHLAGEEPLELSARGESYMNPGVEDVVFAFIECRHFLDCVAEGRAPLSDGESGLRVVRVLEGLQDDLDASRRAVAAVRAA
jgi:predicted dehydrogenase